MKKINQQGFTLVELLLSLVLGLLVSAAALQLFFTGQRSALMQQGSSNLLNSGYFGLDYIVRDLRLANLAADETLINDKVLHGGIVLAKDNISKATTFTMTGETPVNDFTTSAGVGPSNLDEGAAGLSDQLVIQYKNEVENQFDCEGNSIPKNAYVVQRYFLREDTNSNDPNKPLALACVGANYEGDNITSLNLKGDGEIIIPRVDHLRILLGVASDVLDAGVTPAVDGQDGVLDHFGYLTIDAYKALTTKPQIVSVKLGMLVRSPNSVGKSDLFSPTKPYNIFDVSAPLKPDSKNDLYMRSVVTQTVALRNGFGLKE
ncbi:prepilin-type N-terminal cleavage/methylation domain-containing protein [Acinetobacter sp. 194]|uniref:PilW family protein n=1 Tax=Acinetobacter shaoyimingii TaxID=2715164 RepID=UPI0014090A0D|nr:PilW family protein [Acinetobacter shaoyimingii]NHB58075.1 prepilin-type N-terminal cleavage/methylation domain-containing protein [Acinetobacter shaoyimingii]